MRRLFILVVFVLIVASLGSYQTGSALADPHGSGDAHGDQQNQDHDLPHVQEHPHARVCSDPTGGDEARCHSHVRTDAVGVPAAAGSKSAAGDSAIGNSGAYDPTCLWLAYGLASQPATCGTPSTTALPAGGSGSTVAIVDAYDDPNAQSDLSYYRSFFGLGPCSTGCFTKIDEYGNAVSTNRRSTDYVAPNTGWAFEISLDLQMVSAICPKCKILLVEARSASYADLARAVTTAGSTPGVIAISNSYGGGEFSGEGTSTYNAAYNQSSKGIFVMASSGDSGYGVEFPAASQWVTAVGGTTLNIPTGSTSRPAANLNPETAWSGAGSGCSGQIGKPVWQGATAGCSMRAVADTSAVADPNTGVWIYDSYRYGGWNVVGGTSVASPITASVYALAGAGNTTSAVGATLPWQHAQSLWDITVGCNTSGCSTTSNPPVTTGSCGSDLCTAGTGWDGPTGLGTPNGTGGF